MISFFSTDVSRKVKQSRKLRQWLEAVALQERKKIAELNYMLCSDEYLYSINVNYLQHHTYTDIITFDNGEEQGIIEGDIFISLERVVDNASKYSVSTDNELLRVMAHGLLHLCGYKDKNEKQSREMRRKEDAAIALFHKLYPSLVR
ncbi:MAG: rRNA maturation RNase YbeY [Cytophagaceae bacterium]|jgi:rRNA maturation RNase YbeY|nr:rRNA maturation RNase YbeY [Cytophagaceae bacterium]